MKLQKAQAAGPRKKVRKIDAHAGHFVSRIVTSVFRSIKTSYILWNSMTSTSFIFTELANTMKYGGGFLYNLAFTEWRHLVSQNKTEIDEEAEKLHIRPELHI